VDNYYRYREEIALLKKELKTLREDKEKAQKRLSKTGLIDSAIINLYLEMKDRSAEYVP
jgi:hypothetical protein